ncbi:MAG: hypothetical protein QOH54_2839 [Mycobacterium sp.]|nr:hypothetical protein [Mycobacterium sp.]
MIQTFAQAGGDPAWWGRPRQIGTDLVLESLTNSKALACRYLDYAAADEKARRLRHLGHIGQYQILPAHAPEPDQHTRGRKPLPDTQ